MSRASAAQGPSGAKELAPTPGRPAATELDATGAAPRDESRARLSEASAERASISASHWRSIAEVQVDEGGALERGTARGERERAAIQRRVERRLRAIHALGIVPSALAAKGREVLDKVSDWDAAAPRELGNIADELTGLACGSGIDVSVLVWLSASPEAVYESLVLAPRGGSPAAPLGAGSPIRTPTSDDCDWREETLLLFVQGPGGPVLGLAHRDAGEGEAGSPYDAPSVFVASPTGGASPFLVLAQPGALGGLLLTRSGLLVASASLSRSDPNPDCSVFHEIVHRQLLSYGRVEAVERAAELTTLRGRFVAVLDAHSFSGIECAHGVVVRTQKGGRTAHLHANHAFDPVLRQRERVRAASTSFDRTIDATTLYAQVRPASATQVLAFLSEVSCARPHARRRQVELSAEERHQEVPWTLCVAQLLARSVTVCASRLSPSPQDPQGQESPSGSRSGSTRTSASTWRPPADTLEYGPWPEFAALARTRT